MSSLTVDTRHVIRYPEQINLNSFKSHSQCLDCPLILKPSRKEMMDYFTDDNVSPSHSFQSRATSILSPMLPLLDLTSCTRLTLGEYHLFSAGQAVHLYLHCLQLHLLNSQLEASTEIGPPIGAHMSPLLWSLGTTGSLLPISML